MEKPRFFSPSRSCSTPPLHTVVPLYNLWKKKTCGKTPSAICSWWSCAKIISKSIITTASAPAGARVFPRPRTVNRPFWCTKGKSKSFATKKKPHSDRMQPYSIPPCKFHGARSGVLSVLPSSTIINNLNIRRGICLWGYFRDLFKRPDDPTNNRRMCFSETARILSSFQKHFGKKRDTD